MIPSVLLAFALAATPLTPPGAARTSPPSETKAEPPKIDTSIDHWRTPAEALTERMIGTASKSVRFDWRKSPVGFALIGSELLERNNFGSTRLGLLARKPLGAFIGEVGIARAFTWSTDSSEKLALTPYRQFGRPSRFELDINASYPFAEGVVTAWPSWFPATELVLSGTAGIRYLFYPGALGGQKFLDVTKALLSPKLSQHELDYLEATRPPGMQIDAARYGLLAGLTLDIYVQPGAFVSPRVMVALPLLAPATGSGLGFWWEMTLGVGWAL